jgi:hypothetical protein
MAIDLALLHRRFTTAGITQSAVRLGAAGTGITGMRSTAREFCSGLKLNRLPKPQTYEAALDEWTDQLKRKFPEGGQYWGVARKCLNIFMRDASYSVHLCETYPCLKLLEHVLEVPLDSFTANGLLREEGADEFGLRRWNTIIRLTREENGKFQKWAGIVAEREGISRVHLDLIYFPFP